MCGWYIRTDLALNLLSREEAMLSYAAGIDECISHSEELHKKDFEEELLDSLYTMTMIVHGEIKGTSSKWFQGAQRPVMAKVLQQSSDPSLRSG